jgi:hypothetical protein
MLSVDTQVNYWLNEVHWVEHPFTHIPDPVPPKKRKKSHSEELPFKIHAAGKYFGSKGGPSAFTKPVNFYSVIFVRNQM